jgi:hypothetical protein
MRYLILASLLSLMACIGPVAADDDDRRPRRGRGWVVYGGPPRVYVHGRVWRSDAPPGWSDLRYGPRFRVYAAPPPVYRFYPPRDDDDGEDRWEDRRERLKERREREREAYEEWRERQRESRERWRERLEDWYEDRGPRYRFHPRRFRDRDDDDDDDD